MKFIQVEVKKTFKKNTVSTQSTKSAKNICAVVALGSSKDKKNYILHADYKAFKPVVEHLFKSGELSLGAGASCLVRYSNIVGTEPATHVLFVAVGHDKRGVDELGAVERLRRLGASTISKLKSEKIAEAVVYLDSFVLSQAELSIDPEMASYAFIEGMGLAAYQFKKYFSSEKGKKEEHFKVTLVTHDANRVKAFSKGLVTAENLLEGTYFCRELSNEPSNILFPEAYANRLKKICKDLGAKCTVLAGKALEKEKMGLLIGVGQGSANPPQLVVMEYKSPSKTKNTIAFVGKGITFDSGGISIKPSMKMEDMKHDMSGSAAVVGAFLSVAKMKLKANVIAIVALAENMPDGNAINPGNILTSRAGKTVEIVNTDAEGRLVLADALDYVQDMNPDYIIDLATLTGAIGITLGKSCSGLMGNDSSFNKMVHRAAEYSGERVWELPLFEEYFDDLKSEFADMRNSGDTPYHGTAKGAMFLKQFIRKGSKWVHLDIASMAYNVSGIPYYPRKSSTGYGVRLLVELTKMVARE